MTSFSNSSLLDPSVRQEAEMEQTIMENVWQQLILSLKIALLETKCPNREIPCLPQRLGQITVF